MPAPQEKSWLRRVLGVLLYALVILLWYQKLPVRYHSLLLRTIPALAFCTAYCLGGALLQGQIEKRPRVGCRQHKAWRWHLGRRKKTCYLPPEVETLQHRLLIAASSGQALAKMLANTPMSKEARDSIEEISAKERLTVDDLSRILDILEAQL